MEALRSIETSATIYQSARRNIPEDLNLVLFTLTIKEKPQYHNQKVGEGIQNAESFGEFEILYLQRIGKGIRCGAPLSK